MLSYIFEDKFIDCYIIIDGSFVLSTDKLSKIKIATNKLNFELKISKIPITGNSPKLDKIKKLAPNYFLFYNKNLFITCDNLK